MKVTLLGIEHFFRFLGLDVTSEPEDYRRDREQRVFSLYKLAPAFLGGLGKSSVREVEVAPNARGPERPAQPLTVFLPAGPLTVDADGIATVVVAFHGGAFCMGSHDTPAIVKLLRELVEATGVVAVSAQYRKMPEFRFPAWATDASAAIAFVWEHLVSLPEMPVCSGIKLVVMGDSAGGNIACSAAHAHRSIVAHGLYLYPILNLSSFESESWQEMGGPGKHLLLSRSLAEAQCSKLFSDPAAAASPRASPLLEIDWEGVPSCHLLVGHFDPLCDDARLYHSLCHEHGVHASLSVYSTAPHGWISFPQSSPEQVEAVAEMIAWLRLVAAAASEKSKRWI